MFKLKKPIVFFDLESTGIDVVNDRIVEIAILKIHTDFREESLHYKVNPTIPIPPAVTKIHGISDEDIKNAPKFVDIAHNVYRFIQGCDIAGYNSTKFDVPMLTEELLRAGVDFDIKKSKLVDVQVIFHKMEQRTLTAAYKFYCNKELINSHSADADTRATYEVFKAQLERYADLPKDMEGIAEFSSQGNNVDFAGRIVYNDKGVEVFNFGKHKGIPVSEIFKKEPGYYNWMMAGDFPLYTKKVLTAIKLREAFGNLKLG